MSEMDIRKSDIFIIAGLLLAVAVASDLAHLYPEYRFLAWGAVVGVVTFAYMTGLRRGIKRRQD